MSVEEEIEHIESILFSLHMCDRLTDDDYKFEAEMNKKLTELRKRLEESS